MTIILALIWQVGLLPANAGAAVTGWQIATIVTLVLLLATLVVGGILLWRGRSRKRPELADTAEDLARDKLEATKREAQHTADESRERLEAELERERQATERDMNRDDPDTDIHGRYRKR